VEVPSSSPADGVHAESAINPVPKATWAIILGRVRKAVFNLLFPLSLWHYTFLQTSSACRVVNGLKGSKTC
jgi:hypothetical protein